MLMVSNGNQAKLFVDSSSNNLQDTEDKVSSRVLILSSGVFRLRTDLVDKNYRNSAWTTCTLDKITLRSKGSIFDPVDLNIITE